MITELGGGRGAQCGAQQRQHDDDPRDDVIMIRIDARSTAPSTAD